MIKILLFLGITFFANPAYAACTGPVGVTGDVIYNTTHDMFQACTERGWFALNKTAVPAPVADTTPDAFNFTDQTDVPVSTLRTSNSISITGIDAATPVSVTGDGSPQIRINGGSWVTSGTITNGQSLEVRLTSSADNLTMHSATVDVGGVLDAWSVTTDFGIPPF